MTYGYIIMNKAKLYFNEIRNKWVDAVNAESEYHLALSEDGTEPSASMEIWVQIRTLWKRRIVAQHDLMLAEIVYTRLRGKSCGIKIFARSFCNKSTGPYIYYTKKNWGRSNNLDPIPIGRNHAECLSTRRLVQHINGMASDEDLMIHQLEALNEEQFAVGILKCPIF